MHECVKYIYYYSSIVLAVQKKVKSAIPVSVPGIYMFSNTCLVAVSMFFGMLGHRFRHKM